MMKQIVTILIAMLFLSQIANTKELTDNDKQSLYKIAEPIIKAVMDGYNNDDYTLYSKYFDEQLKHSFPEKVFKQVVGNIKYKIGNYKSRTQKDIIKNNQFKVILYSGQFEKETDVEIRLVLQKYKNEYLISGLWFNSPKLRE